MTSTQSPPAAGWGAQPTNQTVGQPPVPQQQQQPQFPQSAAPPSGFSTAPPAGFGSSVATPVSQPVTTAPQQLGQAIGYTTTAPPLQVVQPTPHASPVTTPGQQLDLFQPAQQPVQQPVVDAQPVQQPVVDAQPANGAQLQETGPTVQAMLRAFAKQPGCERFKADSEKVKLLEDYIWCRQLTPDLSFELFLQLYAPLADFDDTNCKHPADAIKQHLPRAKKQAEEKGTHQWSAKEIVDYVALYVDVIREAEQQQIPLQMTFLQFVQNQQLLEGFHAGAFKEPVQPKGAAARKGTTAPRTVEKVRPSAAGQRAIYTAPSGRQFRGVLTSYWQDPQTLHVFADFRADSGEEFSGSGINSFEVADDPLPNPPQTNDGTPLPELGRGKLTIPKAQYPSVLQALSLTVPMGTVQLGDNIYSWNFQFTTGHVAVLDVVNGETGPYVDACLCLTSRTNVVAEINPPRKNVAGIYTFETPEGSFLLEVVGNQ